MDKFKFESRADSRGRGGQIADYLDVGAIESAKQLAAAIATLTEAKNKMSAEDAKGNAGKIGAINREIEYYMTQQQAYTNLQLQIEMADSSILNSALKKTEAVLAENDKIKSSSRSLADSFQLTASEVITDTDQMVSVLDSFSTSLQNPTSIKALEEYGNSFEILKQKQAEGLSTKELEKYAEDVRRNLELVRQDFMQLAENEGITLKTDPEAFNQLLSVFNTLNPQIDTLGMSAEDLAGSLGITEAAAANLLAEAASMGDGADMASSAIDGEAESVYDLKTAYDHLAGSTEQKILDTDELIWQYQTQANVLAGLTEGTQLHTDAQNTLNGTKDTLLAMYPELFASEAMSILSTEDKINAIREEVNANDVLRAALKASRDGQLTADEDAVLSSAVSTKAKIQHINQQILALDKLAQALGASSKGLSAASAAASLMPGNGALALSLQASSIAFETIASHGVGIYEAQLDGLQTTQRSYIDTLEKSSAVMGNTTTAANKNAAANQKAAETDIAAAKAAEEKNEKMEESIFLANKYKKALEKLELVISRQAEYTSRFPEYSKSYQDSLRKEIKLQQDKLKLTKDQAKALEKQIKSGDIVKYGVTTTTTPGTAGSSGGSNQKLSGWGGRKTSNYGWRTDPFTKKQTMHSGVDIAGALGTRLDANVIGKVLFAGSKGNGFGNYVMVEAENGIKHIYAHLSKVAVKIGDKVAVGMKLGEIGSTGKSTGSHLHYETRNSKNQSFDSSPYLNAAKKSGSGSVSTSSSGGGSYSGSYAKEINSAASKYNVNPHLIAAMIKQESNFNARAVSPVGAKGLMQLMPGTARELGVKNSFNAQDNVNGGTKYIAQQLKSFGGDITKALAAYNAGPGNVRKYGGIPPFKETQNYVKKVLATFNSSGGSSSGASGGTAGTPGSTTQTTSKDIAATKEAIDSAQSELVGLNGEILTTEQAITALQTEVVNSQIAGYAHEVERYQKQINIQQAKRDSGNLTKNQTKDSLVNERTNTRMQMEVQKEELAHLQRLIKSGHLTSAVKAELTDRTKDLMASIQGLNNAQNQLKYEVITNELEDYAKRMAKYQEQIDIQQAKRDSGNLNKQQTKSSLNNERSNIKLQMQIQNGELAYLQKIIRSGGLTVKVKEEMVAKTKELMVSLQGLNNAQNQMKYDVIANELDHYAERVTAYQKVIDMEIAKTDSLDQSTRRYQNSLERQRTFMGYQKQVHEEELAYLQKIIRSGDLTVQVKKEMTEKVNELTVALEEMNTAMKQLTFDQIMVTMKAFEEQIDDIVYEIERINGVMGTLEEGTPEYSLELQKQLPLLAKQKQALIDQRNSLQNSLLIHDLTAEKVKEIEEQIEDLGSAIWGVEGDIVSMNKKLEETAKEVATKAADALIDAYKGYIEQKRDMHDKALEKEMKTEDERHEKVMDNYADEMEAFQKIIQQKLEDIDRADSERGYDKEIDELEEERRKLQDKMNLLTLDNSLEAKAERKSLQEELDAIDENISEKRYGRELELRKENLNDMLEDKQEETTEKEKIETEQFEKEQKRINELREYWGQFYDDQINDERRFAKIREEIINGSFDNLSSEFNGFMDEMKNTMPDLENTLNGTMEGVGTSIRKNLIEELERALKLMEEVTTYQSKVPNSTGNAAVGVGGGGGGLAGNNGFVSAPQASFTQGDIVTAYGKFLLDNLREEEPNKLRKQYIKETAYKTSAEGRRMGSKYDASIRFDELIAGMGADEKTALANYMNSTGLQKISTPALQAKIKEYAARLMSSSQKYDTGGYTGDFNGGKLATLHEKELVLNKKHTQDYFEAATSIEKLQALLNPIRMPKINSPVLAGASGERSIEINFNVENMNATKQEANNFASIIQNNLKRNKGVK